MARRKKSDAVVPTPTQKKEAELKEFEKLAKQASARRQKNREKRKANLAPGKVKIVRQQLIDDLMRVLQHPCNPWKGWAASRARYRKLGHFPEVIVGDFFGNHAQFQREAGLRDSRGTSKVKNLTARMATEQTIREYAEACVLNHCDKHAKLMSVEKWGRQITAIILSDLHSKFIDPFAFQVALDVIEMTKPELVVLNGDVVDFPKVGRYTTMPGATNLSLQDEIDFVRQFILPEIRKRAPDAILVWHIGNHEYRLIRYLADTAPDLHDLNCLRFDELFGVEEFDIEMVFGNNFLSARSPDFYAPRQKDRKSDVERRTWRIYFDAWAVTHGYSISKTPAKNELERFGCSGTSGHTHRPQLFTIPTAKCPTGNWMSTGMMANEAVGQHYVTGPSAWTMGFGIATIDLLYGEVVQHPITVYKNWATFRDIRWDVTAEAQQIRNSMWD